MEQNTLVTANPKNAKPEIFSEEKSAATIVEMVWETNYNNKLGCDAFIHIDLKGRKMPERSQLENMLFKISTKDGSHEPVIMQMYDIIFFPLRDLPDQMAMPSHGITAVELCQKLMNKNHTWLRFETEIACYYYKKINQ